MQQISSKIHERPAELLQNLIRFDTTNPPGNELACIQYINDLLKEAGIECKHRGSHARASQSDRPAERRRQCSSTSALRPRGCGYHRGPEVDPPALRGKIVDGYVWGRGALDMKGGVAMLLAAFLEGQGREHIPAGGRVFCCRGR